MYLESEVMLSKSFAAASTQPQLGYLREPGTAISPGDSVTLLGQIHFILPLQVVNM